MVTEISDSSAAEMSDQASIWYEEEDDEDQEERGRPCRDFIWADTWVMSVGCAARDR